MSAPAGEAATAVTAAAQRVGLPELAIEGFSLGLFMFIACLGVVALEHPASPLFAALPSPLLRRLIMGAAMGLTAVAIIYSPWGQRSGAHLNPAVSLTFHLLGRIGARDAALYALAQLVGGSAGVGLAFALLGTPLAHPAVDFAATTPGALGEASAFAGELVISFLLMAVVLVVSGSPRARLTGLCAGALVMLAIAVEAPLSGMSMNPARTLASALFARRAPGLWIYLSAPPLGMLAAGWIFGARDGCAKLDHAPGVRCLFCLARRRGAGRPPAGG